MTYLSKIFAEVLFLVDAQEYFGNKFEWFFLFTIFYLSLSYFLVFIVVDCRCNPDGVIGGFDMCNEKTGQCLCKPAVTGRKCGQCSMGTYKFEQRNPFGCQGSTLYQQQFKHLIFLSFFFFCMLSLFSLDISFIQLPYKNLQMFVFLFAFLILMYASFNLVWDNSSSVGTHWRSYSQ